MNTHQELDEILEVSRTVYINVYLANIYYLTDYLEIDFLLSSFMLCFSVVFLSRFRPHADGRTFKLETHQEILVDS